MSFQLPPGFTQTAGPSGGGGGGRPGGGGGGGGPNGGGSGPSEEERAAAEERMRQQEEMKRGMIKSMLEPAARERLSRIALTRAQLASQVEDLLVRMAQGGQIRGQVSDEALKGLLEQVSSSSQPKAAPAPQSARTKTLGGGITIQRKRDDSDSDEYDL